MRPQDFLEGALKDIKFRISFPDEIVTTQECIDEYAIEFAEWSVARAMGLDSFKLNNGELETFKKAKKL
jgi:hypothetical protein